MSDQNNPLQAYRDLISFYAPSTIVVSLNITISLFVFKEEKENIEFLIFYLSAFSPLSHIVEPVSNHEFKDDTLKTLDLIKTTYPYFDQVFRWFSVIGTIAEIGEGTKDEIKAIEIFSMLSVASISYDIEHEL